MLTEITTKNLLMYYICDRKLVLIVISVDLFYSIIVTLCLPVCENRIGGY